jgi:D-alanyl-D-alanine dipeptidase
MKSYLQTILDDISFENLSEKWWGFDFDHVFKRQNAF